MEQDFKHDKQFLSMSLKDCFMHFRPFELKYVKHVGSEVITFIVDKDQPLSKL